MLTFTDIFCGAGGSSIGLAAAGYELKLAANHWQRAIDTHAANFADAEHLCADVSNYDMRRLPRTDVLWASPICTEISPAGGRRRSKGIRGQGSLLEEYGYVSPSAFDRTRATAFDVIRATEVHRYSAVLIENVVEFATDWELFDWWLAGMTKLGYNHQIVCVSSAHVGDEGNAHAPQWRDRLYIVFTQTGIPLPDVTPRPLAWCPTCDADVAAVQSWKNPRGPKLGKYRQQYVYRCPNSACRHAVVEPYVSPAASVIDWSDLGVRIGDRGKPLAAKTMARIQAGLDMFAQPTMVNVNHDDIRTYPAAGGALPSRTTKIGDGLACPPMLVPAGGTWNNSATAVSEPMRTRTVREAEGVVTPPFLAMLRGNANPRGVDEPLNAVMTGRNHALIQPEPFVTMLRRNGTATGIRQPLATMAASGNHHALVIPYRRGAKATTTAEPLHTLHTRESAALLGHAVNVDDCRFRMLKPREHLRAQRFPDSYVVVGNKGEQTMQAGNAVSSNVAQFLGQRVAAVLDGAA